MNEEAFISLSNEPINAQLILTDVTGKVVLHIENISTKEIKIDRNDLAAGLYFFKLIEGAVVIGNGKVIMK